MVDLSNFSLNKKHIYYDDEDLIWLIFYFIYIIYYKINIFNYFILYNI